MRRPAEEPTPRPARRSSTDGRPPPHRGESTAAPGRDGERVVPHRRATDEGKRPSARGGGHHKNDLHTGKRRPMPRHADRKRWPEPGNGGRRLRTKSGLRPSGVRRDKEGTKGQRGERVKKRRGEEAKRQRVEKKAAAAPLRRPAAGNNFFLQFVNLCVTLRDKAP